MIARYHNELQPDKKKEKKIDKNESPCGRGEEAKGGKPSGMSFRATSEERNIKADLLLGRKIQRRKYGTRKLHPTLIGRCFARLSTMYRSICQRARSSLYHGYYC